MADENAPGPGESKLSVEIEGEGLGHRLKVLASGSWAAYILLGLAVVAGFWRLPTLPGYFILSLVALVALCFLSGYRLMGSHTERLERENVRLTSEVERIANEKSQLQGKVVKNRRSSED